MVKEGGDIQLECLVSGSPAPRISWLLNGEPVGNDSHVQTAGEQHWLLVSYDGIVESTRKCM
jgi:hypothetical protein